MQRVARHRATHRPTRPPTRDERYRSRGASRAERVRHRARGVGGSRAPSPLRPPGPRRARLLRHRRQQARRLRAGHHLSLDDGLSSANCAARSVSSSLSSDDVRRTPQRLGRLRGIAEARAPTRAAPSAGDCSGAVEQAVVPFERERRRRVITAVQHRRAEAVVQESPPRAQTRGAPDRAIPPAPAHNFASRRQATTSSTSAPPPAAHSRARWRPRCSRRCPWPSRPASTPTRQPLALSHGRPAGHAAQRGVRTNRTTRCRRSICPMASSSVSPPRPPTRCSSRRNARGRAASRRWAIGRPTKVAATLSKRLATRRERVALDAALGRQRQGESLNLVTVDVMSPTAATASARTLEARTSSPAAALVPDGVGVASRSAAAGALRDAEGSLRLPAALRRQLDVPADLRRSTGVDSFCLTPNGDAARDEKLSRLGFREPQSPDAARSQFPSAALNRIFILRGAASVAARLS